MQSLIQKEDIEIQRRLAILPSFMEMCNGFFTHYKGDRYRMTGLSIDEETRMLCVLYVREDAPFGTIPWSRRVSKFFGTVQREDGYVVDCYVFSPYLFNHFWKSPISA